MHMTSAIEKLLQSRLIGRTISVGILNGKMIFATMKGVVEREPNFILEKISYVFGFTCNLIFVEKLVSNLNCPPIFFSNSYF